MLISPGNHRAGGKHKNPDYTSTFVFSNDFPAVLNDHSSSEEVDSEDNCLFKTQTISGVCQVICYSPRHNSTMAQLSKKEVMDVINTWTEIYQKLAQDPTIAYVQLFENKGAAMGCSNPHPHGQVWATSFIPQEPAKEIDNMQVYYAKKGSCLLCDYVKQELEKKERIVYQNDTFVVLVPFWALWPFETLVLPKDHRTSLLDLSEAEKIDYADALLNITIRYDNLFKCLFPYSMGIHQSPVDSTPEFNSQTMVCHLHVHFYPPLLRSATVKKFLVGFEMLGELQRDLTAEQAASKLSSLSTVHFLDAS